MPLKLKFLLGEQKVLEKQTELVEQEQQKEAIKQKKMSILNSLLEFAKENEELCQESYLLAEWVKIAVLKEWQVDILLILGLKTIPEYNFFELLKVACEINQQDFEKVLENNDLEEEYQKYLITPKNKPIFNWGKTVNELQGTSTNSTNLNLNSLRNIVSQQIQEILSSYQFSPEEPKETGDNLRSEEKITNETPQSTPQTSRYDDLLTNLSTEEDERLRKKKDRKEAKKKLEEEELKRRKSKLSEKDRKLQEAEKQRQKERDLAEKEAEAREKARLAREKTLQEEQDNLFQQKMKNITEAKKRAEENLTNQKKQNELEEQKKRDEIIKLEQENQQEQERLTKRAQLIEEEKIKKLESIALEDKEERLKIEKKANEEKARIQSEADKKKRENEEELKKKENILLAEKLAKEEELKNLQKEVDLQKRTSEETEKIEKMRQITLRDKEKLAQQIRESNTRKEISFYKAISSVLNYYVNSNEFSLAFQNATYFEIDGKYLPQVSKIFEKYPQAKVNLYKFYTCTGGNKMSDGIQWVYDWHTPLQKTTALVGDKWYTKEELEAEIKANVPEDF